MPIADVCARHLIELFTALRSGGKLAPKSIYNVYSVLKALFRDAQLADLIDQRSPSQRSRIAFVGVDAVESAVPAFEAEVEFIMREIADAVQELGGPGSLTAVVDALEGDARSHLASGFADDLRRYGLLEGDRGRVRIGVFARWLHRNVSLSPRAAHG